MLVIIMENVFWVNANAIKDTKKQIVLVRFVLQIVLVRENATKISNVNVIQDLKVI
jgi:hypothetical protein